METTKLKIAGMTCGHCVAAVGKALRGTAGVTEARVDLASGSAEVDHAEGAVSTAALVAAVREAGYAAEPA